MLPDGIPASMRSQALSADIMAEPIRYLCSDAANGLNDERIVAKEFPQWLAARGSK
jgi:gluconate 5-dehydrogenase